MVLGLALKYTYRSEGWGLDGCRMTSRHECELYTSISFVVSVLPDIARADPVSRMASNLLEIRLPLYYI